MPHHHAEFLRLRGCVQLANEAGAAGEADLRAAIKALTAFGAVPSRARAEAALAVHLAAHGERVEAAALAAAAADTFRALGATTWLTEFGYPAAPVG